MKSYLLPILVNKPDISPKVLGKANQFVSFKFGDTQLLYIMSFFGGATSLDFFLKTFKTNETKNFSPMLGSIVQRNWATENFFRMTPSLTVCATANRTKKIKTTLKTFFKMVYLESKHWLNYGCTTYLPLEQRITPIGRISRIKSKSILLQIVSSGVAIKLLSQS